MELTFRKAEIQDADILIDLYNSAFYDDYVRYGGCPAYGVTREHMEKSAAEFPKVIAYHRQMPAGVISFKSKGGGEYYIGCLAVKKEYQGQGAGTALMKHFMSEHPDWKELTLVTPRDKEENVRFYTERFGFEIVGEENDRGVAVYLFRLKR